MAIRNVEGTRDMLPEEALFWEEFKKRAQDVFSLYGYQPIDTPIIELTELFVRGIGEATDVVSKEMFTAISGQNLQRLIDGEKIKSKSRISMRPEGTAGVVRAAVQHDLVPQGAAPAKLIYAGPMFRAERPQLGRQRQFNQVGVECLGADAPSIDAEGIIMLMRFFEEIGIPESSTRLLVNSMGCEKCRPAYRQLVLEYLRQNADALCDTCKERMEINPLRAFDCKNEGCIEIMANAPKITDHLCEDCSSHYATVLEFLKGAGINYIEDPSLVRGLDYYTRTVFEVQTGDERAQNAIGGGGRYDKLSEDVGGRAMPGFGFALGYERCVLALKDKGFEFQKAPVCQVFVACATPDTRGLAFDIVQSLRSLKIPCEMDHQGRSLKSQFKLADKLGAEYVIILGADELAEGLVKIRDMNSHEERLVGKDDIVFTLREELGIVQL